VRVIASPDGVSWESVALLTSKNSDLRDPKITVVRLMASCCFTRQSPCMTVHVKVINLSPGFLGSFERGAIAFRSALSTSGCGESPGIKEPPAASAMDTGKTGLSYLT
jgi:hypothetical protein